MKIKHSILCGLRLPVAAAPVLTPQSLMPPAWAQQETASPVEFDRERVTTEGASAFKERASELRRPGQWELLCAVGLARSEAKPSEAIGWNAAGKGAFFLGDVADAIVAWEAEAALTKVVPGPRSWLTLARAIERDYARSQFRGAQVRGLPCGGAALGTERSCRPTVTGQR